MLRAHTVRLFLMRVFPYLLLGFCTCAVAGCTTSPEALKNNDPFEPMNRTFYDFDKKVEQYALLPIAGLYVNNVPKPVRLGIHNVLANAEEPVTIINDVLQLKIVDASRMTAR